MDDEASWPKNRYRQTGTRPNKADVADREPAPGTGGEPASNSRRTSKGPYTSRSHSRSTTYASLYQ